MKPPSHLVLYRDEAGQPTRFFGPFVSDAIAQFFKAEMPEPLEGGFCKIVPVQPYTQSEGHIVHRKLMDEREARLQPTT